VGFSPETINGGEAEKIVQRGDEVLQLEEGTGEVRHSTKGTDEGGTGELTDGERNSGVAAAVRSAGADTRPRREGKVTFYTMECSLSQKCILFSLPIKTLKSNSKHKL
jgi:hypothetical protein